MKIGEGIKEKVGENDRRWQDVEAAGRLVQT